MSHAYFDDSARGKDLHRRSLRGGAMSMISQGGNVATQVISTIVLARILVPEDFGLVAMVSAITGYVAILVDLGTRDAVAQHPRINTGEASALYWITAALGLAVALLTVIGAPLIASFYGAPKLKAITMALAIPIILSGLYYQQYALMRRALLFRKLAIIDVSGNVVGTALAILLAHLGYGYWALVWKPAITAFVTASGVWVTCGWWPGRPTLTQGVRAMIRFGLNVTGFNIADTITRAMDRVALGHNFGPRELGFYQNALNVYENAANISSSPLHNVASATLSKLRDDIDALKGAWSNRQQTASARICIQPAPQTKKRVAATLCRLHRRGLKTTESLLLTFVGRVKRPPFLLTINPARTGYKPLLGVLSTRLARVADRVDALAEQLEADGPIDRSKLRRRLAYLRRRSHVLDAAVMMGTGGGVATSCAALLLFVGTLRDRPGVSLFVAFGLALFFTMGALLAFLIEMLLASRGLRDQANCANEVGEMHELAAEGVGEPTHGESG